MIHATLKIKLVFAALAATKKSLVMSPVLAVSFFSLELADIFKTLGPHGTSYVFALICSLVRWPLFKLSTRDGLVGVVAIPVLAYIFVNIHPPWIDGLLYITAPEDYPMIFGAVFGLIPNLLGGWILDFATILAKAKAGQK